MKPIDIANKIIKLTEVNIFDDNRKKNTVEYRALCCFLLREKLKMRWTNIANFFKNNGKSMHHATAIHLYKNYNMYKKYNKNLNDLENIFSWKNDITHDEIDKIHYLENKVKNLQDKLDKQQDLSKLINKIPNNKYNETYEQLNRIVKGYEWKSKLATTK